jgi:hypothetical protein
MVMRVASFFPFQTTYYLNGHSFLQQELNRQGLAFRQHDNAFLLVADPEALQQVHPLSPARLRPLGQPPLSRPTSPHARPKGQLEAAYHKADASLQQIIDLVQAA